MEALALMPACRDAGASPCSRRVNIASSAPARTAVRVVRLTAVRRHASTPRRVAALAAPSHAPAPIRAISADQRPSSAEAVRTIIESMTEGTLCTVCEDGFPLGTFTGYVLDSEGQPILRVRKGARHAVNLLRDARCSLYVMPPLQPERSRARVTLLGTVEPLDAAAAKPFAAAYAESHGGGVGVDAVAPDDLHFRLRVATAFFVGGLGTAKLAEEVPAGDYATAESDPLAACAAAVASQLSATAPEDLLFYCSHYCGMDSARVESVVITGIDRLGFDLAVRVRGAPGVAHKRVAFLHEASSEMDARSQLTMMAQVAWEEAKNYNPPAPPPLPPVVPPVAAA